ncbi:phosphate ABC transporter substrate-binding protein [Glaciimonas sp. PCH181]|uniref:phosphate ABC transporter substrate-binding protein n=1 Tax=Glaciimonas sp. PCH181 TaxID=2133943 RepID=UPI000D3CA5EE|nr:phosphate ABC transporter substrate-binding protein [Glaciimonas sp. PCH181]PUA20213.1 ABC transporter substrate-binding protein [Glaciimonas sp. PCH181]
MRYSRIQPTLAALLACISLASCDDHSTDNRNDKAATVPAAAVMANHLKLTGASTTAALMKPIVERYQALHPEVSITIEMGGAERGVNDARNNMANIGMVSRLITDKDQDIKGFPVARDGAGLLVHKDNPVTSLSSAQIVAIFTGRIVNWKTVGGRDAPIIVIKREEGRGTVVLFMHYFKLTYADIKARAVLGENSAVIAAVVAQPNAISLMSVIVAEQDSRNGVPIKLIALDGIAATHGNILSGDYPLARPLTLVTRGLPEGLSKNFIAYSLSPQVADIVEKLGFVPYQE